VNTKLNHLYINMSKTFFGCALALTLSTSAFAVNWSAGGNNTYTNGAQDNTFTLGVGSVVNSNSSTQNGFLFMTGFSNTSTNSTNGGVYGNNNSLINSKYCSILGNGSSAAESAYVNLFGNYNVANSSTLGVISGHDNKVTTTAIHPIMYGLWNQVYGSVNSDPCIFGISNQINSIENFGMVLGRLSILSNSQNSTVVGDSNNVSGAIGAGVFGAWNQVKGAAHRNVTILGNGCIVDSAWSATITGISNSVNGGADSFVGGNGNAMASSINSIILGPWNKMTSATNGGILGVGNVLGGSAATTQNAYLIGAGLKIVPESNTEGLIVLGFNNKLIPVAGTLTTNNVPLLIVANGPSDTARSNALLIEKSGRTTITSRNFITPTTQNPTPVQPETLVVEGSARVKGTVVLDQRQGDIWMGGFGRTEDQGPAN
jgi:hypothetical protein